MIKNFNKKQCLDIYKKIRLIRRFEESALKLGEDGEIPGSLHLCIGQEAIPVGVCYSLEKSDYIIGTHRSHGHMIAKGCDIKYMFAELMGRKNGYNKGKGGSMHIAEPSIGMLGATGVVGGGLPIAVGVALANKFLKNRKVIVSFFGDGAMSTGASHEAMNMAALWDLPIVFICENNNYAISTSIENAYSLKKLSDRAKAYGIPGTTIDGMCVDKVYNCTKKAVYRARNENQPSLIEFITYRYRDHSIGVEKLQLTYRNKEEINYWEKKCPMKFWAKKLIRNKICTKNELIKIENIIEKIVIEAIEFARSSKFPKKKDALKGMYVNNYKVLPEKGVISLKSNKNIKF